MEYLNWNPPDWIVYPGGALGIYPVVGRRLWSYMVGMDKKDTRVLVVNATGANTLYQLVNGLFEDTKLKWNGGKVDTSLIDRFYQRQTRKEHCT